MYKLFYFPTAVGTFYLCRDNNGAYFSCIEDIVLDQYESLVDAVETLAYDTSVNIPHPEMGDPLDPTDLGVPDDIGSWKVV